MADVDLPDGWRDRPAADRQPDVLAEYGRPTDAGATFVVSLLRGGDAYTLRVSTIEDGDQRVRHDYRVETYDRREDARAAAGTLARRLDAELADGDIDPRDPDVAAVRGLVGDDPGLRDRLLRFVRDLR